MAPQGRDAGRDWELVIQRHGKDTKEDKGTVRRQGDGSIVLTYKTFNTNFKALEVFLCQEQHE